MISYGAIVAWAAESFRHLPGRILTFKPLLYVGNISYGLYVYHYFAPYIVSTGAKQFSWESILQSQATPLVSYSVFTLATAVLSWHLYEYPINRLKHHFVYPQRG